MPRKPIIDVYCRLPSGGSAAYVRGHPEGGRYGQWLDLSEERFFQLLETAGITTAVGVAYANQGLRIGRTELPPRGCDNDRQAALQRRFPGRYIGVAAIDPSGSAHAPVIELERCVHELGLRLAGIEPGRAPLYAEHTADRRLYPFYERAEQLGVTVMLQTSGLKGGVSIEYANPRWVEQVAADFPELTIVCCHACHPFTRELVAVATRRSNVYVSPDLYVFAPGRREWVYAVNRRHIADRFLFATGFPFCGHPVRAVNRFLLLGWRPALLDRVLYRNAIRALRLDTEPVFARLLAGPDRYSAATILLAAVRLTLHEAGRRMAARSPRRPHPGIG